MRYAIGVDLGGTQIKALAITSDEGRVLKRVVRRTNDQRDNPSVTLEAPLWAAEVKAAIDELRTEIDSAPDCLGLCAPGLAAKDGLTIFSMPGRMSGLEGFDWSQHLGLRSLILNDGQAALLGEVWLGAAQGVQNAIMLTLGTGVGGAIFADGRLLKGHIGRAGHFGHFCLDVDGDPDDSGMPGSLELAIGDLSIRQRSDGAFSSTKDLVDAVLTSDESANLIWKRSIQKLASAIASMINAIDPERVVLGGGIANAGPTLYDLLNTHMDRIEYRPSGHNVPIVPAQLGEWSGAIGAAYNALTNLKSAD